LKGDAVLLRELWQSDCATDDGKSIRWKDISLLKQFAKGACVDGDGAFAAAACGLDDLLLDKATDSISCSIIGHQE